MHQRVQFVASLLLLINCTLSASTITSQPLLVIEPNQTYQRNSEGDMVGLKDGRLALVYTRFMGGDDDHSSAELCLRTTKDEGVTWSEDRVLVPNEGGRNVMSVSLLKLPSNEILLFYLRKDGQKTSCSIYVRRSKDDLATVSDPVRVSLVDGYHVMNNARVLRSSKGRIFAPAMLHAGFRDGGPKEYSSGAVPFVYYSDDDGHTWKKDTTPLDRPTSQPVLQENGLVELSDGRIMMYMRTNQGSQFTCESTDHGMSWTKPAPTNLKSPLSPATIRPIAGTRDLLCVWNDHSGLHPFVPGKRTPLCLAISHDEGKTWGPSSVLEGNPDGWYCYTSIFQHKNRIYLSYCAGDKVIGGLNRLKVVALPVEGIPGAK